MNKKKIIIAAAIVIGLVVVAFGIKKIFFKNDFAYAGTIEAVKINVPARVGSVVDKLLIRNGQDVQEGQLLLSLSCDETRLHNALVKQEYARTNVLLRQGSASKESFEKISNEKSVSDLKTSWCDVKSPLRGTVLAHYVEAGEAVVPNQVIFTLANLDKLFSYIYVPQPYIANLKLGQNVTAYLPEIKKQFTGVISEISELAEFTPRNVQTRSERERLVYSVKVEMDNKERILKPGMTVEIHLPEAQ